MRNKLNMIYIFNDLEIEIVKTSISNKTEDYDLVGNQCE